MYIWSFCMRIHMGPQFINWLLWGIESAQNLTLGKLVRKAWHVTVTCPCGGHAWLCLTWAFESECSHCALPTLPTEFTGENICVCNIGCFFYIVFQYMSPSLVILELCLHTYESFPLFKHFFVKKPYNCCLKKLFCWTFSHDFILFH